MAALPYDLRRAVAGPGSAKAGRSLRAAEQRRADLLVAGPGRLVDQLDDELVVERLAHLQSELADLAELGRPVLEVLEQGGRVGAERLALGGPLLEHLDPGDPALRGRLHLHGQLVLLVE